MMAMGAGADRRRVMVVAWGGTTDGAWEITTRETVSRCRKTLVQCVTDAARCRLEWQLGVSARRRSARLQSAAPHLTEFASSRSCAFRGRLASPGKTHAPLVITASVSQITGGRVETTWIPIH